MTNSRAIAHKNFFVFTQKNRSEFLVEQKVMSKEQKVTSNEQKVASNEQKKKKTNNVQRAKCSVSNILMKFYLPTDFYILRITGYKK